MDRQPDWSDMEGVEWSAEEVRERREQEEEFQRQLIASRPTRMATPKRRRKI